MSKHLVIAAAGTGGHVMPGIAVAKILRSRGWTVSWIGTEKGMERRLVGKSRTILSGENADVVFSTGGYIAVPVCLAAGLKGVPYVLMNSDADPLLSIKMVQGNAAGIMCGFDGKAAKLA